MLILSLRWGPGANEPTPTIYPGTEKLVSAWKYIYEKYGSCQIHLVGGEPFHYPDFMKLIIELSKNHTWECSTNLSWDVDKLIKNVGPGRARIGVSFSPEFVEFDVFFKKAKKLKEAGFEVWANYVAYPQILSGMKQAKEKFGDIGISMSILPFNGKFLGKNYPEAYSDEEKQLLRSLALNHGSKKHLTLLLIKQNV